MLERVVVIVPTYNEAESIARTLRSVAAQRLGAEVLVVDRQGEDATREVVQSVAEQEKLSVTVIDDTTHTMSGARRLAVEYAREHFSSEYFLSMDADTVIPDGWARDALQLARAGGYALVAGEGYFDLDFWKSVPNLARGYAQNVGEVFFPREVYDLHSNERPLFGSIFQRFGRPPSDCAMLVSSAALAQTGDIPEELDENGEVEQGVGWPLMVRLFDAGLTMTSLGSPTYETSARRLVSDAAALIDSTTYAGGSTAAFRADSQLLRSTLDAHADQLDFRELQEYVIRNYVVLACLLRPKLIGQNAGFFGAKTSLDLRIAVGAERDARRHRVPAEAFAAARRLTARFSPRILEAFESERA